MKSPTYVLVFGILVGIALTTVAGPVCVDVRYLHAAIWPRAFAGTPENTANFYSGSICTNIDLSSHHAALSPCAFFISVFGSKNPKAPLEFVGALDVWRFQQATTNYTVVHSFQARELQRNTNFVSQLMDGDVLYFHGIVD